MTRVGFKTGPLNFDEGKRIVTEYGADFCELWYRIDKPELYIEIIPWLLNHNIAIGLHHWGIAGKSYKTNLATSVNSIRLETIKQIKDTINIAAEIGAVYVNAHPGAEEVEVVNFSSHKQSQQISSKHSRTPTTEATNNMVDAINSLQEHATSKKVLLTLETLPSHEKHRADSRTSIYAPGNPSLDTMRIMAKHTWIANDITHTIATASTTPAADAFTLAWQFTNDVADRTRLLHINTVQPPHNGSDSHDGILPQDLAVPNVLPTIQQLSQLASLFKERDDCFAVPEPHQDMASNFLALKKLFGQTD